MSMIDFASHIIAIANQNGDKITSISLQPLMFLTIRQYLLKKKHSPQNKITMFSYKQLKGFVHHDVHDSPLYAWTRGIHNQFKKMNFKQAFNFIACNVYDSPFYPRKQGPIEMDTFNKYEAYANQPIKEDGHYKNDYKVFDKTITSLLNYPVQKLINMSKDQPFWQEKACAIADGVTVANAYKLPQIIQQYNK